jgi:hypothetical protein
MVGVGIYPNVTIVEEGFYFSVFSSCHNDNFNAFIWFFFSGNWTKILQVALRFLKFLTFSKKLGPNIIAKNKNLVIEWHLHP